MTSDLASPTLTLRVPGGRVAYSEQGSGPLVVLSPGMGELRSGFHAASTALASAGFRAVSVDLRGHGDSDVGFPSYGDEQTAGDLLALIEHLDAGPAVLVGSSMSAAAAVLVAARRPDAVAGLVLTGPFVRNPPAGRLAGAAQLLLFRALMARPWAAAAWNAYLPTLWAGVKPADFAEHRAAISAALARPGYAAAFSATTRVDHAPAEAVLSSVSAPTLVVMGALDPDFRDPAAESQWIASRLPGPGGSAEARVELVPDSGHYPHAQRPELVLPLVLDFLSEIGVGPRA